MIVKRSNWSASAALVTFLRHAKYRELIEAKGNRRDLIPQIARLRLKMADRNICSEPGDELADALRGRGKTGYSRAKET
jgi:hypothetical protein